MQVQVFVIFPLAIFIVRKCQGEYLGVLVDTAAMNLFVVDSKVVLVLLLGQFIVLLTQRNQRLVSPKLLRHFSGFFVPL